MKTPCRSILFLLLIASALSAKTMVLFTGTGDAIRATASLDSVKFEGPSSAPDMALHYASGASLTQLSAIDSIRFYNTAIELSPERLYNSAKASPIFLDTAKTSVTLDVRNRTTYSGEIITDPIDPADTANSDVPALAALTRLTITVRAQIPAGATLTVSYKTGSTFFSDTNWSAWQNLGGLHGDLANPAGRYLKLRLVLTAASAAALPLISKVSLYANYRATMQYQKPLTVTAYQNEKIITSDAYPFAWETRDNPAISAFMTARKVDTIGTGKTTEFDKILAVVDWVARHPKGGYNWSGDYPWDISKVYGTGIIYGHCMSYAEVLVTALTGLGYYARHWAMEQLHKPIPNNHEVVEYWSDSLRKWIYLDPSLDTYYKNTVTQAPMSILEMHKVYVKYGQQTIAPIAVVDAKYHYGVFTSTYAWRSAQGYTTAGQMKLTTRNDFHSRPMTTPYDGFGNGFNGYRDVNLFPNWMDTAAVPYDSAITNYSGRERDFWYTMNQASIKAKRTAEKTVEIEFGNSQPFFKRYMISVNGGAPVQAQTPYSWTLNDGSNTLKVSPENNWGEQGISSELIVQY